jgi:hypothetical protein
MTIIPDKHTFTIWQGATFYEVLTLYSTMDRTSPRNLTGYTAEMIIRDKPNGTALLTLATLENVNKSDGCSISLGTTTADQGQIRLQISDAVTKNLGKSSTWKSGVYDLTITNNGVTDALLYGGIKVVGV